MLSALGTMLRRRWALVGGVFLLLLPFAAWIIVRAGGEPSEEYVVEAQLAVRDPRPVVSQEDLAYHLPKDFPASSHFTREGLLTAPEVYRRAAVVFESYREAKNPPNAAEWVQEAGGRIETETKQDYKEETHGSARARLEEALDVRPTDLPSGLIRIRASSSSRDEAVLMADAFAWSARRVAERRADKLMGDLEKAFEKRLQKLLEDVAFLELELGAVEHASLDRSRRLNEFNASIAGLGRRIDETLSNKDRLALRVEALEAAEHRRREVLPAGPEEDGLTSSVLTRLRGDMDAIRITIAQEGLARTPEAARTKDLMRRLAQLETAYRTELDRVRARTILELRQAMDALDGELRLLDERRMRKALEVRELTEEGIENRPGRAELERIRADLSRAEEIDRRLRDGVQPGRGFYVVFGAAATDVAAPVGRGLAALWQGLLAAAVLALLAGFLAERGDTRVRSDADVKGALNLPSLAVVEEADEPAILRLHPQDPLAETYAMAGTMLLSYLGEREFKSFAVTSASAQEGKTTVAANLAVAIARKGLDVLLIDADLRRPRLHEVFGLDNAKGLSTLLSGEEENAEDAMAATEIPSLRILPGGPAPDVPTDLVESPRMAELHRTLREKFDVVILDAPPVTEVGDGLALSRLADTNVWVVRSGRCDRRELGWARHLLGNVRADVAGVVLTFARRRGGERFYSYPVASTRA